MWGQLYGREYVPELPEWFTMDFMGVGGYSIGVESIWGNTESTTKEF